MKKTISFFLSVVLLFSLCACEDGRRAEASTSEESLNIDGEWYAAPITELSYIPGIVGDNAIAFTLNGEEAAIHSDGRFTHGGSETYLRCFYPSKESALFYAVGEKGPVGLLSIVKENEIRLYLPQFIGRFLISDGEMTPFSSGEEVGWEIEKIKYKIVDNTLYLLRDGIYMPCELTFYGEDLFLCVLDIDPLISADGSNLGRPGYCYVRASAIK